MKPLRGTILLLAVASIASLVFFRAFKSDRVVVENPTYPTSHGSYAGPLLPDKDCSDRIRNAQSFVQEKEREALESHSFNLATLRGACAALKANTAVFPTNIECAPLLNAAMVLSRYDFDPKAYTRDLFKHTGVKPAPEDFDKMSVSTPEIKEITMNGETYRIIHAPTFSGFCTGHPFEDTSLEVGDLVRDLDEYVLVLKKNGEHFVPIWGFYSPTSHVTDVVAKDINNDGRTEILLGLGVGGNCWSCYTTMVLSFRGSTVKNLTAAINRVENLTFHYDEDSKDSDFVDLNHDGIDEIKVLDSRFEFGFGLDHASSPGSLKIFKWTGKQYEDRSTQFRDYYLQRVKENEAILAPAMKRCDNPHLGLDLSGLEITDVIYSYKESIISEYLDYENMGMKSAGWQRLQKQMQCVADLASNDPDSNWHGVGKDYVSLLRGLRKMYTNFGTIVGTPDP